MGITRNVALGVILFFSVLVKIQSIAAADPAKAHQELKVFDDAFERVYEDNVDKIETQAAIEGAINGMIKAVDPNGRFIPPKELRDMMAQSRGDLGAIGLEITMGGNGMPKVVSAIEGTAAARAGMSTDDVIVKLDDEETIGWTLDRVIEKMRGAINSKLKFTIVRKGSVMPAELSIARETIRIQPIKFHIEGDDVGYIHVVTFNDQTADALKAAITELNQRLGQHVKGFVLDLRNNPGGFLDPAIAVADAFLESGDILSSKGRASDDVQRRHAKPGDLINGKPLIVLINHGSAAGAEVVAGALQDNQRAKVVGTQSFGRGVVQTIIPLGNGNGAIKITTARMFTPSGQPIDGHGIKPDFVVDQPVVKDATEVTLGQNGEDMQYAYALHLLRH
jgi:carboxyl-terminal processing protease